VLTGRCSPRSVARYRELPRVMGRGRALEVLLSSDDIGGADAEFLGYVNRALPDAELDNFVEALASRIASFDKWRSPTPSASLTKPACRPTSKSERAGTPAWPPSSDQRRRKASKRSWTKDFRSLETRERPISLSERKHTTMDLLTIAKNIADRVEAESTRQILRDGRRRPVHQRGPGDRRRRSQRRNDRTGHRHRRSGDEISRSDRARSWPSVGRWA